VAHSPRRTGLDKYSCHCALSGRHFARVDPDPDIVDVVLDLRQ
jgi:hypothetical protein